MPVTSVDNGWDDGVTTASLLGQFRRDLLAEGVPEQLADSLVFDAGRNLTGVGGPRVSRPDRPGVTPDEQARRVRPWLRHDVADAAAAAAQEVL